MPDLLDADPKLKKIAAEIRRLLERHQVAGAFQLASSTHAEFGMELPPWSAIWFEEVPDDSTARIMRIKSSSERDGPDHLASSAHLLLSIRDMMAVQMMSLFKQCEALEQALANADVELEHTPFFAKDDEKGEPAC